MTVIIINERKPTRKAVHTKNDKQVKAVRNFLIRKKKGTEERRDAIAINKLYLYICLYI